MMDPNYVKTLEDIIVKQDQRIAELEKQIAFKIDECLTLDSALIRADMNHLKCDLRQQAKGIEDAVVNSPSRLKFSIPLVSTLELYNYADTLNKQADELEQSE